MATHVNTSVPPRRQPYWYHPHVVRLSVIGHSQLLPHGHGTHYHNTFGMHPLFSSSAENWRPFGCGRRSLMPYDNVLCFICSPVVRCWSFTTYWLLQTDVVDIVWWSCNSSAIVPPKPYSFLLLLLLLPNFLVPLRKVWLTPTAQVPCSRLGRKVNFAPAKFC